MICSEPGCQDTARARGKCWRHYQRWYRRQKSAPEPAGEGRCRALAAYREALKRAPRRDLEGDLSCSIGEDLKACIRQELERRG